MTCTELSVESHREVRVTSSTVSLAAPELLAGPVVSGVYCSEFCPD